MFFRLFPAHVSPRSRCLGATLLLVPESPARPRPGLTLEIIASWCGVAAVAVLAAHLEWSGAGFLVAAAAVMSLWFHFWLLPRAQERRLRALAGQLCLLRFFRGPYVTLSPVTEPTREVVLPTSMVARRFAPRVRPQDTLIHRHRIFRVLEVNGLDAIVQETLPAAQPEPLPLIELLHGRGEPEAWPSPVPQAA